MSDVKVKISAVKDKISVLKAILANPQMIRVKPSLNWFLLRYMKKFRIKNVGDRLIIHSHLPPLNSKAYSRFVNEHLLGKSHGPSHAQIGVTNACPQRCAYCYNRERSGRVMDTGTIMRLIQDLKRMGMFWLGFTGGEPLLNKDLVRIVASAGDDCALKLFTTGHRLTAALARELEQAGLFSVSVSLDHWLESEHDRARDYRGAYRTALQAIETLRKHTTLHVSVSAVLSKSMLRANQVEEFLHFLEGLGVHEAWLSEAKPSVQAFWDDELVITEQERLALVALQDRHNKQDGMTVNYLAHFEGREHFGCNAGHKMVYVDAFGNVSPCVFTPMSFGNISDKDIGTLMQEMQEYFPSESSCFINRNFKLMQQHANGSPFLDKAHSAAMMKDVHFTPMAKFFHLYYS